MIQVTIHLLNESETHSYMDMLDLSEKGKTVFCNSDAQSNIEMMKLEFEILSSKKLGEAWSEVLSNGKDRGNPIKPIFALISLSNGTMALYWRNIVNQLSNGTDTMMFHELVESFLAPYDPVIELYSNMSIKAISMKVKGKLTPLKNLNQNQFL